MFSGASHLTFTKTNTKRKGWECSKVDSCLSFEIRWINN